MQKFWQLLEESVIIQGIVTVALIGAMIYLWVSGQDVPSELYAFGGLVLGYYFGSKVQLKLNQRVEKRTHTADQREIVLKPSVLL